MLNKIKNLFLGVIVSASSSFIEWILKSFGLTAVWLFALAVPGLTQAGPMVAPGWDLFSTVPITSFSGALFKGVSLGTFDFGGAIGVRNVGNADTIVQRLGTANAPSGTIPIEMLALQLMSTAPVNLGAGTDFYYITLQSVHGGPDSVGSMTINFDPEPASLTDQHGTFDSFFDIFFDLRISAPDGQIVFSNTDALRLTSDNVPWAHQLLPPPLEIPGVNTFLNGQDRTADFFPAGTLIPIPGGLSVPGGVDILGATPISGGAIIPGGTNIDGLIIPDDVFIPNNIAVYKAPTGPHHFATTAIAVPEPATLALFAVGGLGLSWFSKRRKAA
jgi:hypothetical protein